MSSVAKPGQSLPIASLLLSSVLLGSCSAAVNRLPEASAPAGQSMDRAELSQQKLMNATATSAVAEASTPIPQQKTQLIKTATLGLRVQDVEPMLQRATQVVTSRGGDILSLQDQVPPSDAAPHTASFKFRVPQAQLDATLADLAKLGTVENRAIQAEDVATQIVDFESRLKNLGKAETVVLGIMERSGSVSDVLKVSQELSQIRNEIEQIQGQVQHLKQQVAFSTIHLTLKEAIAQKQQGVPFGDRLQESWSQSTHALGETTAKLLRLGIWLLVFSPYLVGSVGLILLGRKVLLRRRPAAVSGSPTEHLNP